MNNSNNVTAQVSQAMPAAQPTPAIKATNKPSPPPRDRFIPPGGGGKDVIRQLNKLEQMGPSTQSRAALTEIARRQWSNSPEFALVFLRTALTLDDPGSISDPKDREAWNDFQIDLAEKIRQAVLNLIPKNTHSPKFQYWDSLDKIHQKILSPAISWVQWWLPQTNWKGSRDGIEVVKGMARERPLYADFFCRNFRVVPLNKLIAERHCWSDLSKNAPSNQFIPPGTRKNEVIRRLGSLKRELGLVKGREALIEIAREHWSDSPAFAGAFLNATRSFIHNPDLNDQMRRAILNLIPKDTPPPIDDTSDYTHQLIRSALYRILMDLPSTHKRPYALNFLRGLAKERPLYADFFCRRSGYPMYGHFTGSCEDEFSKKAPLR